MRLVGSNSNVWTNGFGESCAAIVSNNVSAASPWLAFFSNWGPRHRSHTAWPPPERAGGVYRWLARYTKLCRRTGSQLRDSSPWSPNMIRYDIERNRRIRQVRTVVWEDGAARPLLPDPAVDGLRPRVARIYPGTFPSGAADRFDEVIARKNGLPPVHPGEIINEDILPCGGLTVTAAS